MARRKVKLNGFSRIPQQMLLLVTRGDLTPTDMLVYAWLASIPDVRNIHPSVGYLADVSRLHKTTVHRSLKALADLGIIKIESGQLKRQSNLYELQPVSEWKVQITSQYIEYNTSESQDE